MAIDKILQIYDEQGNLIDYDILASDVKFQPDGKDLPTKLAEMDDAIEDAGSGDGTVTGVKVNDTTHEPNDQGVVDIGTVITQHQDISGLATKTELAGKVDKNGTDSLMTAAEHTKLGNLPTATELATQMNAKANDNAVVKTISVNGGTPATPVDGNVDISVEGGGSVESVTVNGTKHTPDINGDVNLGDLRGQDGNSGVASADGVESVNNLNGGTTDTQSKVYVLGANQGKRLRDQIELIYQRIQTLYGLLGNIAFWDGKPSASALLPDLDWGAPKHAVAITNSLSNSVITRNGQDAGSSFQAEEGSTVTLIVAPASGYALTNVSYVKDGGSSTSATSLGDGTYKIEFVMGGSDVAITIAVTAVSLYANTLMVGEVITIQPNDGYYYASSFAPRACLLMQRSAVDNPCTWSVANKPEDTGRNDEDLTTIPIPQGATKVSLQCNSAYYFGLTLVNASGVPQNTVEWTPGSTKKELNFADYPNATHICVNFKIGSAGSANFTNQTYSSMGIDFNIE